MADMGFRKYNIVLKEHIPKVDKIVDVPMEKFMDVYKVCHELELLCEDQRGIGISAVQVGVPWKLFLVKSDGSNPFVEKDKYGYFVNCEYKPVTDTEQVVSVEGCLSVRSESGQLRFFQVERYMHIQIIGYRLDISKKKFVPVDRELSIAEQGVVFQHELDHQFGKLISDTGKEIFIW